MFLKGPADITRGPLLGPLEESYPLFRRKGDQAFHSCLLPEGFQEARYLVAVVLPQLFVQVIPDLRKDQFFDILIGMPLLPQHFPEPVEIIATLPE